MLDQFVARVLEHTATAGDRTAIVAPAGIRSGPRADRTRSHAESGNDLLSWRDLTEAVDRLAGVIRRLSTAQRPVVGVCGPRSYVSIVATLAAWQAGGCCVHVDQSRSEVPPPQLLARCGATVVVDTATGLAKGVDLAVEASGETVPADTAYICPTSGSTAAPRLVAIPATALLWTVEVIAARYGLGARDTVLQAASTGFDVWYEEVWPTLLAGGRVVLLPRALGQTSFSAMSGFVRAHEVTVVNLPSSYVTGWAHSVPPRTLPGGLRLVVAGSETLPSSAVRAIQVAAPGPIAIYNAYGTTETTVTSLVHEVADAENGPESVPIGLPLPGVRALVVDANLHPLPPGDVGELLLGGHGLAYGYLDDPRATAERFVRCGGTGDAPARWYRTGDLAKADRDGVFHLLGRMDDRIKHNGTWLAPIAVEAALTSTAGVRDARVVVEGSIVHAFVVLDDECSDESLYERLAGRLPEQHMPAIITPLAEFPTMPSGKVDRRALCALAAGLSEGPSQKGIDEIVAAAWSGILPACDGSREANFFDCGGDSLLAARVVAEVRARTGRRVKLTDVFANPRLADFAAVVATIAPGSPVHAPDRDGHELSTVAAPVMHPRPVAHPHERPGS